MKELKEKYRSIAEPASSFFKDKGSKFLGYCFPIAHTDEVKIRLQEVKKEHSKATHHCFAYRIGIEGFSFRASDDGEPSGSAGRPILGQIDSAGLTNVLVIVVRYYGGTMLGVPGLIHAYKTTAAESLSMAKQVEKWVCQLVEISINYNALSEVLYFLKQSEATVLGQDLQLFCTIIAEIPKVNFEHCSAQLLKIRGINLKPMTI